MTSPDLQKSVPSAAANISQHPDVGCPKIRLGTLSGCGGNFGGARFKSNFFCSKESLVKRKRKPMELLLFKSNFFKMIKSKLGPLRWSRKRVELSA